MNVILIYLRNCLIACCCNLVNIIDPLSQSPHFTTQSSYISYLALSGFTQKMHNKAFPSHLWLSTTAFILYFIKIRRFSFWRRNVAVLLVIFNKICPNLYLQLANYFVIWQIHNQSLTLIFTCAIFSFLWLLPFGIESLYKFCELFN